MTIGKHILTIRENGGMSLRDFAKRIGVTHQSLYLCEKGDIMPNVHMLATICKEFGVQAKNMGASLLETYVKKGEDLGYKKVEEFVELVEKEGE